MQQAFQARLQLDEDAEVGDLGDLALDDLPGQVVVGDGLQPRVLGELLEAQGDALLFLVHGQDDALDFVALLEQLGGMADLLGPATGRETCSRPSMPSSISTKAP